MTREEFANMFLENRVPLFAGNGGRGINEDLLEASIAVLNEKLRGMDDSLFSQVERPKIERDPELQERFNAFTRDVDANPNISVDAAKDLASKYGILGHPDVVFGWTETNVDLSQLEKLRSMLSNPEILWGIGTSYRNDYFKPTYSINYGAWPSDDWLRPTYSLGYGVNNPWWSGPRFPWMDQGSDYRGS